MVPGVCHDGPAGAAYPRIDDHNVHSAGREIAIRLCNRDCALKDVECGNSVANIYKFRFRIDAQHYAFHGSRVVVISAEIGRERDDRAHWYTSLRSVDKRSQAASSRLPGPNNMGTAGTRKNAPHKPRKLVWGTAKMGQR